MYSKRVAPTATTSFVLLSLACLCLAAPADISIKNVVKRDVPFDDDPVCVWSGKYQPLTYLDCYTNWPGGNYIEYVIRLTGTGMDPVTWAQTILYTIWRDCQSQSIDTIDNNVNSPFTRSTALDGDKGWSQVTLQGVDLTFHLNWPWNTDDDNHECMAHAVRDATCDQIEISNGAHCVTKGYSSADVLEYWDRPGPNHL